MKREAPGGEGERGSRSEQSKDRKRRREYGERKKLKEFTKLSSKQLGIARVENRAQIWESKKEVIQIREENQIQLIEVA
jgi:hypothetical protein